MVNPIISDFEAGEYSTPGSFGPQLHGSTADG